MSPILENTEYQELKIKYQPNTDFFPSSYGKLKSEGDEDEDDQDPVRLIRKKAKAKGKVKYTCACGNNIWGKMGLNIKCGDCEIDFIEQV